MTENGFTLAPLRGDVDLARLLRDAPPEHTIKGAFIASNAARLGGAWKTIEPTLASPPRNGRYLTFSDYPLTDFLRVTDAAARKEYPTVSGAEAHRLLSRSTFDVFAKTQVGRVTVALISNPENLLLKYEGIFNKMVSGPRVRVKVVAENAVEASYTDYFSTREAIYGVLEGAVLAYSFEPTVSVEAKGRGSYTARVSWKKP